MSKKKTFYLNYWSIHLAVARSRDFFFPFSKHTASYISHHIHSYSHIYTRTVAIDNRALQIPGSNFVSDCTSFHTNIFPILLCSFFFLSCLEDVKKKEKKTTHKRETPLQSVHFMYSYRPTSSGFFDDSFINNNCNTCVKAHISV